MRRELLHAGWLAVWVLSLACIFAPAAAAAYVDTYVDDDAGYADADGDAYFCTIQAAVEQTAPAGTVHIAAGIYPEKVDLTAALTLLGEENAYPHICPTLGSSSKYDTIVTVRADDITLRGLEFSNALGVVDTGGLPGGTHIEHHAVWDASWTLGPARLTVDDCRIHDIEHGVRSYGPDLTVTDCEMYNLRRSGVHASGPYQNQPLPMRIEGNWFHDWVDYYKEGAAVYVKYDSRVGTVSHNYISGMRMGIAYYYGGPKAVYGETIVFEHNTIDLDYDPGSGPVETTMGLSLWGTGANADAIIIRDNIFANARWYAIYQEGAAISGQIAVTNNLFYNNYWFYWPDYQYTYQWFGDDPRAQAGWTGGAAGFDFSHNLTAQDPLFALEGDTANAQWTLQCGSPAAHAASDGTHIGAWQGDLVCTIEVAIDIKPGSDVNPIQPSAKGTIPVAVLSSIDFDAVSIDPESLTFGCTGVEDSLARRGVHGKPNCQVEDVDGDGLLDLVCHFEIVACEFAEGDTFGVLRGITMNGTAFEGIDAITITPKAKPQSGIDAASLIGGITVRLYPNPVRSVNTATFELTGPLAEAADALHIAVYDLTGTLVWEGTGPDGSLQWHTESLLGGYLANGVYVYLASVTVGQDTYTIQQGKVVVLK